MLGKNPSPANNGKTSNAIKVMKRDATSVRIVSTNPRLLCSRKFWILFEIIGQTVLFICIFHFC